MNQPVHELQTLARLSRTYGAPDFAKGGGGNTSFKSGRILWIKPSGLALRDMDESSFVAIDRDRLGRLYELKPPADAAAREGAVKDLMMAARCEGQTARPSVETPLHDMMDATYVVHTHAVLANGLTCARDGEAAARRLFPAALWVPYTDPGFVLSTVVRKMLNEYAGRHGRQPEVVLLENHGLVVAGDSPDSIDAAHARFLDVLRRCYRDAGVATELKRGAPAGESEARETSAKISEAIGGGATVLYGGRFEAARGPLSPDHMVYGKAFPYEGPITAEGLSAFRRRHGYLPRVVLAGAGVFGAGSSERQAQLALDLAGDGALVQQLAAAFGGARWLSDEARRFIESWEVESYREQQAQRAS
jgi:rhamnose utilization protein RhaD (predicted bifunctional aldolase and dehydrogenase)